jgi:hypothetical protein
MPMHEKEKLLKDQRTIEATRKGLMGMDGKFGCILKYLGEAVIKQTSGFYEITAMENYLEIDEEEEIQTLDEDDPIIEIGRLFNGLSNGINVEITYFYDTKQLTVQFDGQRVYQETGGDLDSYLPSSEWEDKIENLYTLAKKREKKAFKETLVNNKKIKEIQAFKFLQQLRERWGI